MLDNDFTIVFAGDSVTDCGRRTEERSPLGTGYVSLIAGELSRREKRPVIINAGINGNRSSDLEGRWEGDVLNHEPAVISILIGINDTWRRYDRNDPTSPTAFEANCRSMLDRSVTRESTRVVLVEPFLLPVSADQVNWLEDLEEKVSVVRKLSLEYGTFLLPAHEFMTQAAEVHGPAALAPDGVHPSDQGHRILAEKWLELMA